MKEEYKEVNGFPGYFVSNLGNVKSVKEGKEIILKPRPNHNGYLFLGMYKDNRNHPKRIHRLVAEAFIPNPENKPQVDHINGIKSDNRVDNLRWATNKENMNNPLTIEKLRQLDHSYHSKGVLCIETNTIYASTREAERQTGIKQTNISACCLGKEHYLTAGGYHWRFV